MYEHIKPVAVQQTATPLAAASVINGIDCTHRSLTHDHNSQSLHTGRASIF